MRIILQLVVIIYVIGWLFLTLVLMVVPDTSILIIWIPFTLLGLYLIKKAFGKDKEPQEENHPKKRSYY